MENRTQTRRSYAGVPALIAVSFYSLGWCLMFPRSAQAQGVFDMGMLTNTLSNSSGGSPSSGSHGKKSSGTSLKSALSNSARAKSTKTANKTAPVTFTPSAAVRQKSIASFLSRVQASDPTLAAALRKEFASKDVFGDLARKLGTYGLKTNSVTDAFTVYTVVAWQGVHGTNDDPRKAQVRGVREQMGHLFADVPALTSATDAKKQEFADAFILQAMLIDVYVASAKKRPELMPQVKSALAQGTKETLGLDLTGFKLTDSGLRL